MPGQKSILLIHPPVSIVSEAPAGIARLAGYLREAGADVTVVDLNIEGLLDLSCGQYPACDTWSRRAKKGIDKNLSALRTPALYKSPDRYKRAVHDVNRLLHMAGRDRGVTLSLSNYAETNRTPLRSRDLADAALDFESNLFFPYFEKRISCLFSKNAPDIVGISVNFLGQALCASAIAGFVRKRFPLIQIVFGGGLVTSWLSMPGFVNPLAGVVDKMVKGSGEKILTAMCGLNKETSCLVPGFPYDFEGFDLSKYLSPGVVLPISASDGCYWRKCSFCPESAEKRRYRQFPPDKISSCVPADRPALIHFLDNALSPKLMHSLIANPPGVPWYGFVRITPHLADPDFTAGLASSGCVMLKVGIESGDQGVLDAMGKGTRLEMVSKVLKTLKSSHISVYAYLLFGTPGENETSARKTKDFMLEHCDCIDFLNLAIFNLPAYCQDVHGLETRPFYEGDLSLYREFVHPLEWGRDRVRRFLAREFKVLAPIRKIINNDPPFFTSNHAPFFKHFV